MGNTLTSSTAQAATATPCTTSDPAQLTPKPTSRTTEVTSCTTIQRRRLSLGGSAFAPSLDILPDELATVVASHVAGSSASSLCHLLLVSKVYFNSVRLLLQSTEGMKLLHQGQSVEMIAWQQRLARGALRPIGPSHLLGPIATLSESPASLVSLLQSCSSACIAAGVPFDEVFGYLEDAAETSLPTFGSQIAKCAPSWWTAEHVCAVFMLPHSCREMAARAPRPVVSERIDIDMRELRGLLNQMREQAEFNVGFEDVIAVLVQPSVTPQMEARACTLVEAFVGEDADGMYRFDEASMSKLGTFVARHSIDVTTWFRIIELLAHLERIVEDYQGVGPYHVYIFTGIAVSTWTVESSFPCAFTAAECEMAANALDSFAPQDKDALEDCMTDWFLRLTNRNVFHEYDDQWKALVRHFL